MEKPMRTLLLASIGVLALGTVSAPAMAQGTPEQSEPRTADEANAAAPPLPPTTTVIPGEAPNEPDVIIEDHHGNLTPPPDEALNRDYPVCTAEITDECRNPAEAEQHDAASDEVEGEPEAEGRGR